MYQRNIETCVRDALLDTPVVLLNGARQTGKTTLALKLASELSRRYVRHGFHPTLRPFCNVTSEISPTSKGLPKCRSCCLYWHPESAASVGRKDFNGIEPFAQTAGDRFLRGIVLYAGDNAVPFGERLHALPISSIWQ
jgi:hypothetical protein